MGGESACGLFLFCSSEGSPMSQTKTYDFTAAKRPGTRAVILAISVVALTGLAVSTLPIALRLLWNTSASVPLEGLEVAHPRSGQTDGGGPRHPARLGRGGSLEYRQSPLAKSGTAQSRPARRNRLSTKPAVCRKIMPNGILNVRQTWVTASLKPG